MTDVEKTTVKAVIQTLNAIPVTTIDGMSRMLACAQALQKLLDGGEGK